MTEIERLHEERINALDNRVDVLSQKVDDFIAESRAARAKTDEELKEMRADMRTMNQRMDAMNQRMDNTLASIHNLTMAAMAGIGAIAVAVIISLFK